MTDDTGAGSSRQVPSTPVQIMGWRTPAAGDFFEVVKNEKEARHRPRADGGDPPGGAEDPDCPGAAREPARTTPLRGRHPRVIVKADAWVARGRPGVDRQITAKAARSRSSTGRWGHQRERRQPRRRHRLRHRRLQRASGAGCPQAERLGIEIRTYSVIYELLTRSNSSWWASSPPRSRKSFRHRRGPGRVPVPGSEPSPVATSPKAWSSVRPCPAAARRSRHLRRTSSTRSSGSRRRSRVSQGFECGIGLANFNDIKEGDLIEVYEIREIART